MQTFESYKLKNSIQRWLIQVVERPEEDQISHIAIFHLRLLEIK